MLVLEQDYEDVVQIEGARLSEDLYWSMEDVIKKIYLVRKIIEKFTKKINKKYDKNTRNIESEYFLNIFNYFGTFEEIIIHQRPFWSLTGDEFGKRNIDRRINENIEFNLFLLESFKHSISILEKMSFHNIYEENKSVKKIIKKMVRELNKMIDDKFDIETLRLFHQFALNSSKNRVLSRVAYNRIFRFANKVNVEGLDDFRFMFYESFEIDLLRFTTEGEDFKNKLISIIEEQNIRLSEKVSDFERHDWKTLDFDEDEQERLLSLFKK